MARIHRLDLDATGFGFLRRPELGATPLDQEIAYYEKYYEWAARGRENPMLEAAHDWLVANKPDGEREGLVWGDARIGNMIFDGTKPAAVLDWEMVCGSPERDVGWAIFLDRHHSEGIDTPRLAGFPSYEDTLAYYEERSGHRVSNLHYYQVFAGWRFGIIMLRIAQQVVHYELATPEQGRELELNNTVTRLTAKLLDLPPPGARRERRFLEGRKLTHRLPYNAARAPEDPRCGSATRPSRRPSRPSCAATSRADDARARRGAHERR